MNDTTNRLNDLTAETAQTMLDAAHFIQHQQAQLMQNYLNTMESNHKASRDLVGRMFRQGREAQELWTQYAQESFREATDVAVKTASLHMHEASEQMGKVSEKVNKAGQQATNGSKRAEAAATSK